MTCLKCHLKIDQPKSAHYGLHPECFTEWFKAPATAGFVSLQRRSSAISDDISGLTPQNTSFYHGKFKKYSADLNGVSYILKMRQSDALELPEVEYLCNEVGRTLGIPVAEFYLIDLYGDRTFVTKNFIRQGSPTDLQHIYHFRPDNQHSCEGIINAISKKTERPHDVRVFIQTILFDALIGNHDRHGRNLAFITTGKSSSLSPIYDNVSYLSLENQSMLKADFNPTGKISTSKTFEPSMSDYVRELKRLGYGEEVHEFYKRIKMPQISQLVERSFCSPLMIGAINALIVKRFKELENELST